MKSLIVGLSTLMFAATAAYAHVTAIPSVVPPSSQATIAFRIPHGCDGSPTKEVSIRMPAGVTMVKPGHIPGWLISISNDSVTWTADSSGNFTIPNEAFMDFTINLETPSKGDANNQIYFPTHQSCVEGHIHWTDTSHDGEHPAAVVRLSGSTTSAATTLSSPSNLLMLGAATLLTVTHMF
jgi:uncharacterized protein YcnI